LDLKQLMLATVLLLGALAGPAVADELVLVADQWCPYNCEPGSDAPGFMIELARLAFEPQGHQVTYQVVPWARAIESARAGQYAGIIGAARDEAPDFIFPDEPAAIVSHDFFVPAASKWRFATLESLHDVRLGVIADYSYGSLFDDYVFPNQDDDEKIFVATGDDPLPRIIRMLLTGRVDVVIEDRNVMRQKLKDLGLVDKVITAGTFTREEVFLAFSPARDESGHLAKVFDEAVARLRASGELDRLMEKYGFAGP
jgi:polar amino acid transport system substrate-binding protein